MWGIGLLVEVAIRLVVIANLSVDVANGVNSAISLPVIGLLVVATVVVTRRAQSRRHLRGMTREQTATPPRLSASDSTLED